MYSVQLFDVAPIGVTAQQPFPTLPATRPDLSALGKPRRGIPATAIPRPGKPNKKKAATEPESVIYLPDGSGLSMENFSNYANNGFSGAQNSYNRGYVVFPQLDTRKEITSYSRTEMLRRSRWLYDNVGYAKRLVCGISRMMGALHPDPITRDTEWKQEALAAFWRVAKSPLLFERSGKFNFLTYQRFLTRRWLIDGDICSIFSESFGGSTMVAPFEAHQIKDPRGGDHLSGWFDGVQVDKGNRLKKVRIINPDYPDKYKDYRADVAHLSAFWERAGQPRGVTPFHACITRMLDVREVTGDMMGNIKRSGLVGFYLHSPNQNNFLGDDGLAGGIRDYIDSHSRDVANAAEDGNELVTAKTKLRIEDLMPGMDGAIPELQDIEPKVLHDARPAAEQMNLLNWFIRECSLSFDYSPEVLWDLANLNGNTSRLIKEHSEQTSRNYRSEILQPFCQRYWFHLIGNEIAAGRLREPDQGNWWDVEWIHPKKMTIDRGNEGHLNLEERRQPGMRTLASHYGELQENWEPHIDQWLREIAYTIERAESMEQFSPEMVAAVQAMLLSPPPGAAVAAMAPGAEDLPPQPNPQPGMGQSLNL